MDKTKHYARIFKNIKTITNDNNKNIKVFDYCNKDYSNIPIEVQLLFKDVIDKKNNGSSIPSLVSYNNDLYRLEIVYNKYNNKKLFEYINKILKEKISHKCLNIHNDFLTSLLLVKKKCTSF